MDSNGRFVEIMADIVKLIEMFTNHLEENMDKQIRGIEKKIKKDTKGEEKSLKKLEKADKKRDKVCEMGEKMMKKKGKK